MKGKFLAIFIHVMLMGSIITITIHASETYDPLGGGWIEEQDGVTILHVSGSYYDMGYQHGFLLKDKIEQNFRALFESADPNLYNMVLEWWNEILAFTIPERYIEEIQGLADGSGRSFEEVAVFTIGHLLFLLKSGCSEMVAWGPATADGQLYHYYSADIPTMVKDPVSGTYVHDNQVLILREPEDGHVSLGSFLPGSIGCFGGFNEKAISIAAESSLCFDQTYFSVFPVIQFRMILDTASSAVEAIDILIENKIGGGIYHIGDGNIPVGFVCEATADYFYVGGWDDDIENIRPFWQIDHVLRRKNMFICPLTASTQREYYNPKMYFLLGMKRGVIPWFNPWRYYKTISEETEKIWGGIGLNNTIDMVRSIYRGGTDIFLRLSNKLGGEKFPAYYQWVVCPRTGNMVISFAKSENYAQYEDVHQFNLFDLLESKPP